MEDDTLITLKELVGRLIKLVEVLEKPSHKPPENPLDEGYGYPFVPYDPQVWKRKGPPPAIVMYGVQQPPVSGITFEEGMCTPKADMYPHELPERDEP